MASNPSTQSDSKLARDLAKILRDSELTEIELKRGELRIRVAREIHAAPVTYAAAPAPAPMPAPAPAPQAATATPPETPAPARAADAASHPGVVKSPMVGTVYLKPNPESANFVSVGDSVKEGDTILLIEAMKTFNPITAPASGKVSEILVEDGQPVEYGEPLFIIS